MDNTSARNTDGSESEHRNRSTSVESTYARSFTTNVTASSADSDSSEGINSFPRSGTTQVTASSLDGKSSDSIHAFPCSDTTNVMAMRDGDSSSPSVQSLANQTGVVSTPRNCVVISQAVNSKASSNDSCNLAGHSRASRRSEYSGIQYKGKKSLPNAVDLNCTPAMSGSLENTPSTNSRRNNYEDSTSTGSITYTVVNSASSTSLAARPGTPEEAASHVDLCDILQNSAFGPALLKVSTLDVSKRKLLVDILADHLSRKYNRPSRSIYLAYAKAVVERYPAETMATYYLPSCDQQTPSGKLYFKVVNLNNKRRRMGDTNGTKLKVSRNTNSTDLSCLDDLEDGPRSSIIDAPCLLALFNLSELVSFLSDTESEAALDEMINWLQIHQQPQAKLISFWKKTAKNRINFIHGDGSPDLVQIFQHWPRYKDREGFILITEDFSMMYPSSNDKMAFMWPRIYMPLLDRLTKLKIQDKHVAQLVKILENNIEDPKPAEVMMALVMVFIPLLLPEAPFPIGTTDGKRRKRSVWKPSFVETMDYFINVQQADIDLQAHLEAKGQALLKKHLQLQPHVVVLVNSLDDMARSTSYACLHSTVFYETTTVLEAVDICLKANFVFGLRYPAPAHSAWSFIQKAIYGIATRYDRLPSKVLELLSDIPK